jgi:tetratricopeptide (TPR) repeat protein|tara:strand:+ start:1936 stop:3204 length:1269 start_codon:yes stop_codon:yes gene_type:complete
VNRVVLAGILLAVGIGGVLAYTAVREDREYRRLVGDGNAAVATGDTFLAIEAFSGAVALKPDAMLARLKRGETYRRRGELAAALRDLRSAARLDATATRPLEQLGDVNAALGQYANAEARFLDYLRLDAEAPRILYKLGLSRYRNGNAVTAVSALRDAVALDPGLAEAHYVLGLALRAQDELDTAVAALRVAVRLAPAETNARLELADLLSTLGLHEERIDQLEALAALNLDRPEHQVALGLAHADAGRSDLAVLALGRAAERYPDQPHFYVALGRIWLDVADQRADPSALGKALEALDGSIVQAVNTSAAYVLRGRALLLADDLDGAHDAFQTATERFPVDPEAHRQLGGLALQAGRVGAAREALSLHDALAQHTMTPAARASSARRLGELSGRLADHTAQVRWLRLADEIDPPTGRPPSP